MFHTQKILNTSFAVSHKIIPSTFLRNCPIPRISIEGNYCRPAYIYPFSSLTGLDIESNTSQKLPWPAARVRSPMAWPWLVFNQPDFPSVYLCAIQFVQGTLHVRVWSELNYSFICAFFVSICIGYLPSLPHEILESRWKVTQPLHILVLCNYISLRRVWADVKSIVCIHVHIHTSQLLLLKSKWTITLKGSYWFLLITTCSTIEH